MSKKISTLLKFFIIQMKEEVKRWTDLAEEDYDTAKFRSI